MNCIAVDDEPLALKLLEDNISKIPYLKLVASCRNAFETMKALQEHTVDLIFIDIQMPVLTGLQFIASLQKKPLVIFITAYKQYALDSYELAVVDYLVKPVTLERFIKACNRARELYELKGLKNAGTAEPVKDYFFVNVDYSQVKIKFRDIQWIEGVGNYVKMYLRNTAKPVLLRSNMKALEEQLPSRQFIRIHKSYLVSVESITAIRKNSVFIGDMELPIGETYREAVERIL